MKITPFEHTIQFTLRNQVDSNDFQNIFLTFSYSGDVAYVENLVRLFMEGLEQYRASHFRGDGIYKFYASKNFVGPAPALVDAFDPKKAERPKPKGVRHHKQQKETTDERINDEPRPAA
jgi:hypothetical protein